MNHVGLSPKCLSSPHTRGPCPRSPQVRICQRDATPATVHAQQCTGKQGAGSEPIFRTPQEQEKYLHLSPSQRAGCVCKMRDIGGGGEGKGSAISSCNHHPQQNKPEGTPGPPGCSSIALCVSVGERGGQGGGGGRKGRAVSFFTPSSTDQLHPLPKLVLPP